MSVIKSIDREGRETTNVQPDHYTKSTVEELIARGHTNIRNAETGEVYAIHTLYPCPTCGSKMVHTHE